MHKRKLMSAKQLRELYYLTTHGHTIADACSIVGIEYSVGTGAIKRLRQYVALFLDNKTKPFMRKSYVETAQWIIAEDNMARRKKEVEEPKADAPQVVVDMIEKVEPSHYDKLDLAFSLFRDAMMNFIEKEVEGRVGKVMEENRHMKDLIEQARMGNFADALKAKWEAK